MSTLTSYIHISQLSFLKIAVFGTYLTSYLQSTQRFLIAWKDPRKCHKPPLAVGSPPKTRQWGHGSRVGVWIGLLGEGIVVSERLGPRRQ